MARRSKLPDKAPHPARPASAPEMPRFWFDFSLPWAKVALVRGALFGVLAVDAFLAVRHASHYGAGFNVAHLRFLDGLAPGHTLFVIVELVLAYLFTMFALGVALRFLPLGAALYGWVYFSCQLDSYQHHYLVFLVLVLACFAPWRRPAGVAPAAPARSWALRLVLVQLGIVYAWAAMAKLNGAWLDGTALHQQITTHWMRAALDHVPAGWAIIACLTLGLELFLSIAVWSRPLWWLALPLGILFHVNIELSGLEIGLFSYVMIALYLLTIPDPIVAAAARAGGAAWRAIADAADRAARRVGEWPAIAIAIPVVAAAAALLVARIPFAPALAVAIVVAGAVLGAIAARVRGGPAAAARVLAAHVVAALLLIALDHTTSVARDYYMYWARSARRLGDAETERAAYTRVLDLELDPSSPTPHLYLGELDASEGHTDDARAHWHVAETLRPDDDRAFIDESILLARQGRRDEALAVARAALAGAPDSRGARQVIDALQSAKHGAAPMPAPQPDDEAPP